MKRFLVVLIVALLVPFAAGGKRAKKPLTLDIGYPGDAPGLVYNITDAAYGAIADRVEASGCVATEDTPLACSSAGSQTTDNETEIDLAIDAACAAGGGIVWIPAGKYGVDNVIDMNCSNVWLMGAEDAVILPGTAITGGVNLIQVCPTSSNNTCDASATAADRLTNIRISGFTIRDDDPMLHGTQFTQQYAVNTVGSFIYGEVLDADGTDFDGSPTFYWANADTALVFLGTGVSPGATTATGTVTGARSSATMVLDSLEKNTTAEETHGILSKWTDGLVVENMKFDYLGDEALQLAVGSINSVLRYNSLWQVPGTPGSGSGIDITNGATNFDIYGNSIVLGLGRSHKGIALESVSVDINGGKIHHNYVSEDDIANKDHSAAEIGMYVSAATSDIYNVEIYDNIFDVDSAIWGVCSTTTATVCDAHTDCPPGEHCDDNRDDPLSNGGGLYTTETGGGVSSNFYYARNRITGPVKLHHTGAAGFTRFEDNIVSTATNTGRTDALYSIMENHTVSVTGNTFTGFGARGVRMDSDAGISITFSGNTWTSIGGGWITSTAWLFDIPAAFSSITYDNNAITASQNTAVAVRGWQCGNSDVGTLAITNNTIKDVDHDVMYRCGGTITGNTITQPNYTGNVGIWLAAANDDSSTVSNNIVSGTSSIGIYLEQVDNVTLVGNCCKNVSNTGCIQEVSGSTSNTLTNNYSWDTGDNPGAPFAAADSSHGGCAGTGNTGVGTVCSGNVNDGTACP